MKEEISFKIAKALGFALSEIRKIKNQDVNPGALYLEQPKKKDHGDYAAPVMQLARSYQMPPAELAGMVVEQINKNRTAWGLTDYIEKVEIEGPGFINFFLKTRVVLDIVELIVKEGPGFGRVNDGQGQKVHMEYVSANPTGPLSVAHGRQAAVGDSLANILEFAGYDVHREYYLNDEGNQINLLGQSVQVRYNQLCGNDQLIPEGGYQGGYIVDIAKQIKEKEEEKYLSLTEKEKLSFATDCAVKDILAGIEKDLSDFGVEFNEWFSQKQFERSGKVSRTLDKLKKEGHVYEQDGAVWFKASAYGDEKDRVVVKSDGSQTYLMPDIAYHCNKLERKFAKLINFWGPDHHGYIPRIKAAVKALGYPEGILEVIIVQLCTLYRGKQQLRMSTRAGEYVTLRQVIDEVGRDAGRFFFLMRRVNSHLDFDLDLAKKQSQENPVYYIQYAHARICSIIEFDRQKKSGLAADKNSRVLTQTLSPAIAEIKTELLKEEEELDLIKLLGLFPSKVSASASMREPQLLTGYLQEVAACFHQFYTKHKVVNDDEELSKARLLLINCVRIVIANGLCLLGITAPRKM